jgi:hypothetical protein
MATGSRSLSTHCVPDQPTALRHDARKLGCARLASDDSEGDTFKLVKLDRRGRQWTLLLLVKLAWAVTTRRGLRTLSRRSPGSEAARRRKWRRHDELGIKGFNVATVME